MTDTDLDTFGASYRRMATRLGKAVDGAVVMEAFRDVREHPLPVVEAALETLGRSCRFMPRPVQVIEACRDHARQRATDGVGVPSWVDHQADVFFCNDCHDTGFAQGLVCDGDGRCHLHGCHEAHAYTRKCGCRPTNPVLAHQRDLLRRSAPSRQERDA